jgi:acyl transferase domain-containing protein
MFRRKRESVTEKALRASELALQLAQDKRFREHVQSAVDHGRAVWHETRRGRGLVGAARRLAADKDLQTELRKGRDDLQQASERLNVKTRGHRMWRIAQLAGLASLAAGPKCGSASPR